MSTYTYVDLHLHLYLFPIISQAKSVQELGHEGHLFPGQILAIHISTFGKILRRAILTRTFAKSGISQQISGLVLSREYIFREEARPIFQIADLAI